MTRTVAARAIRSILCCALSVASACAAARVSREPIETDRPDFTESSNTVAKGTVQLEAGSTFSRTGETRTTSVGEALVRIGVAPRVELRLGLNSYDVLRGDVHESGFEDIQLASKVKLAEGGGRGSWRPDLAIIGLLSLPTGGRAFRQDKLQPELKFTQAWSISERTSFSSNLNYAWVRGPTTTSGEWGLSGSLGRALAPRVSSFVEYFGFYPTAAGESAAHYADTGLSFSLGPDLQVDLRGGQGLRTGRGPDYFFGVGIGRRW